MRLTGLWAAAAALCVAAPASATTYFVSPTGSDKADGINKPFLTLAKAVSVVKEGDTIQLRNGIHTGGASLQRANITIQSYPGESATLSVPLRGKVDNTLVLGTGAIGAQIRNLRIVGGMYYSLKIDGNKTDKRTLIENCYIGESGRDCVKIAPGADGITLRCCEIAKSGLRDDSNAEGIDNVCADGMVVQDCYIHDIATNGVYPKGGAQNAIIERTRIENCGGGGVMLGFWTDTEWFDLGENPLQYENLNSIVRNCVIVNTKGAGIGLYSALNPRVFNNTLVNVAQTMHAGILFSLGNTTTPTENARVLNNVVVQPATSYPMIDVRAGSSAAAAIGYNRYHKIGGAAVFLDNTWTGGLAQWLLRSGDTTSSEGDPGLSASYVPAAGSPLIGKAMSLAEVPDDYLGLLRVGAADIGAYETAE